MQQGGQLKLPQTVHESRCVHHLRQKHVFQVALPGENARLWCEIVYLKMLFFHLLMSKLLSYLRVGSMLLKCVWIEVWWWMMILH